MHTTALNDQETTFIPATGSAHISGSDAILARREQFAQEYAIMKAHLKTVGIEKFACEQMEMDKIFKALNLVKSEYADLASHIEALLQYFDYYLPRTANDMRHVSADYVEGASKTHASLAQRFGALHARVEQLQLLPETLLETLGRSGS